MGDVLLTVPILFVVVSAVTLGVVLVGNVEFSSDGLASDDELAVTVLGLVAQTGVFFFWPILVGHWKGTGGFGRDFGLRAKVKDLGIGVGAGVGALLGAGIVSVALTQLLDPAGETGNTGIIEDARGSIWLPLLALTTAVLVPVAEEMLFRGLLMRSVAKRWGTVAGAIVSAVVFSLAHVQFAGFREDAVLLSAIATYAAVLTLLAVRTGRLGPSIVAHMVVNSVGVIAALAT